MEMLSTSTELLTAQMLQGGSMAGVAETAKNILVRVPEIKNAFMAKSLQKRLQVPPQPSISQKWPPPQPPQPPRLCGRGSAATAEPRVGMVGGCVWGREGGGV